MTATESSVASLRAQVREMLDALPDGEVYAAWRYLGFLLREVDPVAYALLAAPEDDEEYGPETRRSLDEAKTEYDAHGGTTLEEFEAELERE